MPTTDGQMRARLVRTSAKLFTKYGYHGTSMADIAAAVKLTKGSLYHYFPSKSDILYEIYGETVDDMNRRIAEHDRALRPDERLRALIYDILDCIAERPDDISVYFQESPLLATQLPRRQYNELRRGEERFTRYVVELVREGVAKGVFRAINPELAALAIIGMAAWAARWYQASGAASVAEIADTFADIALRGLVDGDVLALAHPSEGTMPAASSAG